MPNDTLAAILPIRDENDKLAVFSENGLGKKFSLEEIPLQKRGGKGVICYKSTATSGPVAAASLVADEDDLLIVGDKSMICISAKDIPEMGRAASGNQLIKNSKILSVSKV
jgi:DNA gyrase subunit A